MYRFGDLRQITNDEDFARLCHELLATQHDDYQAIAGEGGDGKIDGFRAGREIVYQFKFSTHRLRPSEYFTEFDFVVQLPSLKEWVLMIPLDPTPRLWELARQKEQQHGKTVTIFDRTSIERLINKYPSIREKYFSQPAKEATVVSLGKRVATKSDIRRLESELRAKRPIRLHSIPPPNSLTPAHRQDIQEVAEKINHDSRGKITYGQVFGMLKNEFRVNHWHWIPNSEFPKIIDWLHRFTYGVRDKYGANASLTRLKGVIQSQRRELQLSDADYRRVLLQLTGVNSSTQMDKEQLTTVRDFLNVLISQK